MKTCLIVIVALLAFSAAPADAAISRGEVAIYLTIAERAAGQHVDCLEVIYEAHPEHPGAFATAELGQPDWRRYGATGEVGLSPGCRIWINPRFWRESSRPWRCDKLAHEYQHLLGRPHTHDGGLMDQLRTRIATPECRRPMKGVALPAEKLLRRRS